MNRSAYQSGPRRALSRIYGWVLTICLLGQSSVAVSLPGAEQKFADFLQAVQAEQARLAGQFNKEAMLDGFDYDAQQIVDFVTEEIVFQAYSGILRGVAGTLAGRAGNAHDQALTLASLLKDAGYEAQILSAELSPDQVTELNATVASPHFPALQPVGAYPAPMRPLIEHSREVGISVAGLIDETRLVAVRVNEELHTPSWPKKQDNLLQQIADSSGSYRWVRYRESPSDPWVEAHPAYPGAVDWGLQFATVESDQIDSSALQSFGMELWIEDSAGAQHMVSGQWSAPTANLMGRPLSIEIGTNATNNPNLWLTPEQLVRDSHYFFVQINNQILDDSKVFDLYGNVYNSEAAAGLDSVFATLASRGNKAAETLGGMGSSSSESVKKQLTKVWLSFRIATPDGDEKTIQRVLYTGEAMNDQETAAQTLLQRWDVSVATTTAIPQYYQHENSAQLAHALQNLKKLQAYIAAGNHSDAEILSAYGKSIGSPGVSRLTYLRGLFDQFASKGVVSYLPEANILAIRQGLTRDGDAWKRYEMADIVSNDHWAVRNEKGELVRDVVANIARGVWETRAETMHLSSPADVVVSKSAYDGLASASRFQTVMDAAGGLIQLVPESGGNNAVWWQVDQTTGSTIGMMNTVAGAGGAEMTEEMLMELIAFSVSLVFAVVGSAVCIEGGGNVACCVVSNYIVSVIGIMLAVAVGAVATAVSIGYGAGVGASVLLDVGLSNITINCSRP